VRVVGCWFAWLWVEWDAQSDLDVPAGDADLLDEQAAEVLFLSVVELVHDSANAASEIAHPAA
jgi:hypothetical protein